MGFPRQEYWSELPFPSPGNLPDSRTESPALADGFFTTESPRNPTLRVKIFKCLLWYILPLPHSLTSSPPRFRACPDLRDTKLLPVPQTTPHSTWYLAIHYPPHQLGLSLHHWLTSLCPPVSEKFHFSQNTFPKPSPIAMVPGILYFSYCNYYYLLLLFSCSIVPSSLRPHGLQHTRPPCPSPFPRACSNSCPLSWWCHTTISSSVVPFSSCLQSCPASEYFPMSQLFTSGGQRIGASASVLPMNIQDWFPLGWTGLISLQPKGLSKVFSNTTVPFLQSLTSLFIEM